MNNDDKIRSEKLFNLYTGAVTDIMDSMGSTLRNQTLPSNLRPLTPDMKVSGPAYTVRGNKRFYDDGADPRYKQIDMLDGVFPGSVILMDSGDEKSAAHWGELMSKTAMEKGATGAIINGGIRDTEEIINHQFPVFASYHSPLTAVYRYNIIDFNNPVVIGGVNINPGDYILGDIDGVICIPKNIIDEVIEEAEVVKNKEDIVRKELASGKNIRDLFEKYQVM